VRRSVIFRQCLADRAPTSIRFRCTSSSAVITEKPAFLRRRLRYLQVLAREGPEGSGLAAARARADDQPRPPALGAGRRPQVPELLIFPDRRYVQYINKTYKRTGTLWDSRYKSSAVQVESYFLLCQRYIELNPVRAGMVDDPATYRWSSY
jgi:hypothetical protein